MGEYLEMKHLEVIKLRQVQRVEPQVGIDALVRKDTETWPSLAVHHARTQ